MSIIWGLGAIRALLSAERLLGLALFSSMGDPQGGCLFGKVCVCCRLIGANFA